MKCLIIAAGQGSRLRQKAESKPLVPILGIPLIERVIESARQGGAREFCVVSGYQGQQVRPHLDRFAQNRGLVIEHIVNRRWREPNGLSVLQAREHLRRPFVLLMADHLFDPVILSRLVEQPLDDRGLILAVDERMDNPLVDLDDVTRVRHTAGAIHDIGKGLADYNAFDTGIFYCSPALFDALEVSTESHGDASLSAGVRVLAGRGRAHVYDIQNRFWLDVDDSRSYVKAEVALGEMLAGPRPVGGTEPAVV